MPMTSVSVGREAVKGALLSACQSLLHLLQERSKQLISKYHLLLSLIR